MAQQPISLDIPIVCTLSDSAFREREQDAIATVTRNCQEVVPLEDGYRLRFSAEHAPELLKFIAAERQCCEFFKFELHFEPQQGPLWFHMRGSEGTKAFLSSWLA